MSFPEAWKAALTQRWLPQTTWLMMSNTDENKRDFVY